MSLLDEFYDHCTSRKESPDPHKKLLFVVVDDLTGRAGFDGAWDNTDNEIKEELLNELLEKIKKNSP